MVDGVAVDDAAAFERCGGQCPQGERAGEAVKHSGTVGEDGWVDYHEVLVDEPGSVGQRTQVFGPAGSPLATAPHQGTMAS